MPVEGIANPVEQSPLDTVRHWTTIDNADVPANPVEHLRDLRVQKGHMAFPESPICEPKQELGSQVHSAAFDTELDIDRRRHRPEEPQLAKFACCCFDVAVGKQAEDDGR